MNAKRTANLIALHRQNRSCGLHSLNLIRRCVCKKLKDAAPSCIRLHDIGIDKQIRRWPTINDADLRVWVPINGSSIQERLLHGQKLKAEICEAQFFLPSSSKSFLSSRPCRNSIRRTHASPSTEEGRYPELSPNLPKSLSKPLLPPCLLYDIERHRTRLEYPS